MLTTIDILQYHKRHACSPSNANRHSLEEPAPDAGGGYVITDPEEAAAVAWQQQLYFQQQLAAAEVMTPNSKQRHMGMAGAISCLNSNCLENKLLVAGRGLSCMHAGRVQAQRTHSCARSRSCR